MSESKAAVQLGDNPHPNTFFFQSPFHSWQFVLNTIVLAAACIESAVLVWKRWAFFPAIFISLLLLWDVIYPYWWALIRHKKVMKLYRSGKIADPALNDLLQVADDSMNQGLWNASVTYVALLAVLLWRLYHP